MTSCQYLPKLRKVIVSCYILLVILVISLFWSKTK